MTTWLKNLISKLTAPKGLFYDGYQFLVERNKPLSNPVVEYNFEISQSKVKFYEHRYEVYEKSFLGWWTDTGQVVYCTQQLNTGLEEIAK